MKAKDPKIWAILSGLLVISAVPAGSSVAGDGVLRSLYAVNQSRNERGSISVYDIDTETGAVTQIRVGLEPHGLTVWPQPGRYSLGHTGNMR